MNRVFLRQRLYKPRTNEEKFWANADKWIERVNRRTERRANQFYREWQKARKTECWSGVSGYTNEKIQVKVPTVTQHWK